MKPKLRYFYEKNNNPISVIRVHDLEVLLTRKRIKNINLRISREGQIKMSAPLKCSLAQIQQFILDRHQWISFHHHRILEDIKIAHAQKKDHHVFLGQTYPLLIFEHAARQCIRLEEDQIKCYVKNFHTPELQQKMLAQWHRVRMQDLLPKLIEKWEPIMDVRVSSWGVKAMKSRWGTCNPRTQKIWLNLYLIHTPLDCLEYVVVHEMVHLLEASHNKRFYALMNMYLPEWQHWRTHLKSNHYILPS